jgi:hypothetical protein
MILPLLLALAIQQPTPPPIPSPTPSGAAPAMPGRVAVISNAGSTNLIGYQIAVQPDGSVSVTTRGTTNGHIDRALAERLYSDLAAHTALSALPVGACMKSASFGTRMTIAYRGETTPDLLCPQDTAERALGADAAAIAAAALGPAPQLQRRGLIAIPSPVPVPSPAPSALR